MNDKRKIRNILDISAPAEVIAATRAAAAQDMCSVSYYVRRALLNDLRERGLLAARGATVALEAENAH